MKERGYLSRGETQVPVDGPIFIGSGAGCAVAVKDAAPRHVQIVRTAEGFVAVDLTGQKLMRVNGARAERHLLRQGEVLTVGSAEFRWTVALEEEPVVVPPTVRRPTPRRELPAVKAPRRRLWPIAAAAAAAVAGLVIVLIAKPSNEDRIVARRAAPVAPADPKTPSSGAVPEKVVAAPPAAAPEPRRDPGGVLVVETPPPPIVEPVAPVVVVPEPAVKPRFSSPYTARYAALIGSLEATLAKGTGLEAAHRELLDASGSAPGEAASVLRSLAKSLKAAAACGDCAGGRVTCGQCDGKGRVDLDCPVCQGRGRVRASGAVGDAQVSVKCRNCEGRKIFRGVTCPQCARAGKVVCPSCKGKPWPEGRCGCTAGRVACAQCAGRGFELLPCPGGCVRGRVRAPGAVDNADVTQKCRDCEVNGQHGNGMVKVECKLCRRTGKVTCDVCGGAFAKKVEAPREPIPASKVFASEPCEECERCFGLGRRILPVTP